MLNPVGAKFLVFGASGRLGGLCADLLTARGFSFGNLQRNGDLLFAGKRLGDLREGMDDRGRYWVVDASIDYSSLQNMAAHEDAKLAFLQQLNSRGDLAGLLAFSSGVTEFDDVLINTEWHRRYRQLKIRLERFVSQVSCPAYCPRLFVVIGPRSFEVSTTGWVDVIRQVCAGNLVGISAPKEARSWVAESYLRTELTRFLTSPLAVRPSTPVNGTFCLGDIARVVAAKLHRTIEIEPRDVSSWLSVPYVSSAAPAKDFDADLVQILAPLVDAHMNRMGTAPFLKTETNEK